MARLGAGRHIAGHWTLLLAIACGFASLLWAGCHPTPPAGLGPGARQAVTRAVTVTRVVSGQTLEVDGSAQHKVRLAGLTAPDYRQQPWGVEAQQALASLVLQQPVTLEPVGELDGYGRQWAYVWQGDRLVNEQLVAAGQALSEPLNTGSNAPYALRLAHAQHRARLLGLGLWNPDNPMRQTPVEFRQQLPAAP